MKPMDSNSGAPTMAKKSKNPQAKFKVLIVIMSMLLIAVAAFAGYLFMQKSDQNKELDSLNSQLKTSKDDLAKAQKELDVAVKGSVASSGDTEYFTIKDWNIRFIMPTGLEASDIIYIASSEKTNFDGVSADSISLTTKLIAAIGGGCNDNSDTAKSQAGVLYRTKTAINTDIPSAPVYLSAGSNDYYYYFAGPQSSCSDTAKYAEVEQHQAMLIRALVHGIQ